MKSAAIALTVAALGLAFDGMSIVAEQQPPARRHSATGRFSPRRDLAPAEARDERRRRRPRNRRPALRGPDRLREHVQRHEPRSRRATDDGKPKGSGRGPGEAAAGRTRARRARRRGMPPVSRFQDWNGDPKFWRAENGMIVGESTPEKVVGPNTFLIWRGGTPGDFELKVEIPDELHEQWHPVPQQDASATTKAAATTPATLAARRLPDGHGLREQLPGMLYEEAGGGFLAERGKITYIAPDGTKSTIGQVESAEQLAASLQARRMESIPSHRPGQHAHPHRERPRDRRLHR